MRVTGFRALRNAGDFGTLDRKLNKDLRAQLTGTPGQDIRQEEERMDRKGKQMSGFQMLWMICYPYARTFEDTERLGYMSA